MVTCSRAITNGPSKPVGIPLDGFTRISSRCTSMACSKSGSYSGQSIRASRKNAAVKSGFCNPTPVSVFFTLPHSNCAGFARLMIGGGPAVGFGR